MATIQVGMSIIEKRFKTDANIHYLHLWSKTHLDARVTIFNKTGAPICEIENSKNFEIIEVKVESLYETICRLQIDDYSHVLWLNDDDEFHLPGQESIENLGSDEVGLPDLVLSTSDSKIKIDWDPLLWARDDCEGYLRYWEIAAPLFFSITPASEFKTWVSYLKSCPIFLPHLDTQLNVLLATHNSKRLVMGFSYVYGAENWDSHQSLMESSRRHSMGLGKKAEFVYVMEFVRNIENIAILCLREKTSTFQYSDSLYKALLRQFSPLQNGRRSWILRNLSPSLLRRPILLLRIKDSAKRQFVHSLPRKIGNFVLGAYSIKNRNQLLELLDLPRLSEFLDLPQESIQYWKNCIQESPS